MGQDLRNSGIDIIGEVPWGTHFCQFCQTGDDLLNVLVPYLRVGLENNELCMWVTTEPVGVEEAKQALMETLPNVDYYLERGQLEIIPHGEWYVKEGIFDVQRVLDGWAERLNHALNSGYDGIRVTGNTAWLERKEWRSFTDYERAIDNFISRHRMIALCTYQVDQCGISEVADVVSNHQFALIKRQRQWEIIESAGRKRADEELRKLWRAIEQSPCATVITDTRGNIEYVNPKCVQLTGYKPEEIIGKNPRIFKSAEMPPEEYTRLWKTITSGGEWRGEFHNKKKNGELYWESVSISPVRNAEGVITHFVAVKEDITERKRLEEEREQLLEQLAAERRRLAVTLHSIGDGVIATDTDGRVVLINRVAEDLTGWPQEEAIGKLLDTVFHIVDEKTRAICENPVEKVLRLGAVVGLANDTALIARDGTERIIADSAAPVRDKESNVLGVVLVFRDVTEHWGAERLREEYISLISHDLRNPLTSLMGYAQLLSRTLLAKGLDREATSAEFILRIARRMNLMIQDLVESSHLESGQLEMHKEFTNLVYLVSDLVKRVGSIEDQSRIHVEVPEWVPSVAVDISRIERAIVNLIANALKYSPPDSPVVVRVAKRGSEAIVAVTDQGIGIPREDLPYLFRRFYRATTGKKSEGLGLGLYIARLIVEAHGGRLWVESEPGKGSTFHLCFPIA